MATVEVTSENLKTLVEQNGIVLVDWWAPWCGPCRAFGPTFEKASETHKDITFGKVNTDEQQELSGTFEIRSIPTIMLFRDRVLLFSQAGALPPNALEELIKKAR